MAAKKTKGSTITFHDRIKLILFLLFAGVLCLFVIVSSAYTAGVRYEINSIAKGNEALRGEIENLNVQIKNATSIVVVEEKAANELGMVNPSYEQCVFLTFDEKPQRDFAMLLNAQAYN